MIKMRIHHILANGKEVESVAGKVINVSEFPMLSSVFRSVNQRIQEQATENEEKRSIMLLRLDKQRRREK